MNVSANNQITANSWKEAFSVYTKPRVIAMTFLGFSAGLPFMLVFTTLSAWLAEAGVSRTAIGFFSWVGITYSIKVLWAPVIDRTPLPYLTAKLGKRRSWMLSAQLLIAVGLLSMAFNDPSTQLFYMAIFSLLVAFGSATQDVAIDAYRIEAMDKYYQGAMAASYVLGYRVALLTASAGALLVADRFSWLVAYCTMALCVLVGMVTTLIIDEPDHSVSYKTLELENNLEKAVGITGTASFLQKISAWFIDAVVSPFVEFFKRNGWLALLILLLIGCYRISDLTLAVMAKPFYLDIGYTLTEIGLVTGAYGIILTLIGVAFGGALVMRFGILRPLLLGAFLVMLTNLFFLLLVYSDTNIWYLALVISADNLSGGIATAAFIAYLSSLTNTAYTATQYALFSSLMTLPGKVIGGFAGVVVDSAGYATFFLYSGALGIPAMLLIFYLMQKGELAEDTEELSSD